MSSQAILMISTPEQVQCPKCATILNTPFGAAVNDKMSCGSCQTVLTVPPNDSSSQSVYPALNQYEPHVGEPLNQYERHETKVFGEPLAPLPTTPWPRRELVGEQGCFAYDAICGCHTDVDSCLKTLFCPCYVVGKNAEYAGENGLAAGAGWLALTIIQPGLGSAIPAITRKGIRNRINAEAEGVPAAAEGVPAEAKGVPAPKKCIRRNLADLGVHLLCPLLATCQEARLIKRAELHKNTSAPPVQRMD